MMVFQASTDPSAAAADAAPAVADLAAEAPPPLTSGASPEALRVADDAIYEQAPCGHMSLDADLMFVKVNQTLLDWLGLDRGDVIGKKSVMDVIAPSWRPTMFLRIETLRHLGRADPLELELLGPGGKTLQAILNCTALFDSDGHFVCSNSVVMDISDRKRAERQEGSHVGFLQAITDRIPVRLAYFDKDLICRFSNAAHASQFGKEPAEVIGLQLSQLLSPELLPEVLPHIAEVLSGHAQAFETQQTGASGEHRFHEIHYIPDVKRGAVEGIFMEQHDITERRRTEELVLEANRDLEERVRERSADLYDSEQRYRLMVDAIQDYCVYFIDEQGIVKDWTESAQRLHGHGRAEMLGLPYARLLASATGNDEELDADQVLRLAKTHGQWETRGWRLRADGSRFWAHTVLTALRNENGELKGLSSITRDMTASKNLEDVMNDLNQELEKRVADRTQQLIAANKDLDVFSHMVSHDLRAPLRHIASFVSLLQEQLGESGDKLSRQYLASIAKASKRMSTMIEGLLEYARLGRVTIQPQPVPLAPLVEGVIAHLKQENPQRNIEWQLEDDLPVVRGDAMLLAEVFTNMLGNSVKFTRTREKARIEIGWRVNPVGGRTFYIHDNGVGFDMEKAHNLFVMFQRQHHSMDYEGSGTGLALSQRIIERHAGRIWAETKPGEGCTFFFTLPFEGLETEPSFIGSTMAELTV